MSGKKKKVEEPKFTWIAYVDAVGLGTSKRDIIEQCTKYLIKNSSVKPDQIRIRRLTGREESLRVEPKLVF